MNVSSHVNYLRLIVRSDAFPLAACGEVFHTDQLSQFAYLTSGYNRPSCGKIGGMSHAHMEGPER